MTYVDTSELHREIHDLERHNKVLQKADRYREKIWKKRVADLEAERNDLAAEVCVLEETLFTGDKLLRRSEHQLKTVCSIIEREKTQATDLEYDGWENVLLVLNNIREAMKRMHRRIEND